MLSIGPFEIAVYQGRHCRFDFGVAKQTLLRKSTVKHLRDLLRLWRLNKDFPENGETAFYEIHAGGKRLHLMGSMGMDETVDYPAAADALILPFQGTGDPAKTVAPIIEALSRIEFCSTTTTTRFRRCRHRCAPMILSCA